MTHTSANVPIPVERLELPPHMLRVLASVNGSIPFAMAFVDRTALPADVQAYLADWFCVYPDGIDTYQLQSFRVCSSGEGNEQTWDVEPRSRCLGIYGAGVELAQISGWTFDATAEILSDFRSRSDAEFDAEQNRLRFLFNLRKELLERIAAGMQWLSLAAMGNRPPSPDTEACPVAIPEWVATRKEYNELSSLLQVESDCLWAIHNVLRSAHFQALPVVAVETVEGSNT